MHEYIAHDLLQGLMFDSMVELDRSFALDRWQLEFQSYALDLNKVLEALNKQVSAEYRGASTSEQKGALAFDS
ncbi:hypothetical protein [Ancylobacter dichloromethanicus]|uniref:hypothetical protein n=1 Tax=Ancylobacter dichloromethanicus TaxID=518825 RepID=UPI003617D79E